MFSYIILPHVLISLQEYWSPGLLGEALNEQDVCLIVCQLRCSSLALPESGEATHRKIQWVRECQWTTPLLLSATYSFYCFYLSATPLLGRQQPGTGTQTNL